LLHADTLAEETRLVGREVEPAALRDAQQATLAGRSVLVAVMGEAGIGKSRLAGRRARRRGQPQRRAHLARPVLRDRQILPFGPWINMLRTSRPAVDGETLDRLGPVWRAELARLLPEIAPGTLLGPPTSDPAQLFEAVVQLLERVAIAQPAALVFRGSSLGR
jgi:predicted ATPase